MGDSFTLHVTVELVSKIVSDLQRGKAAGADKLTSEHLQLAHPIAIVTITRLFNLMISLNYVPDSFGRGLVIPIPKGNNKRQCDKLEDYRGITISPVISKVFEKCLLKFLNGYFATSDRQYGFKKGVGCTDAIYAVRRIVEHFTKNGATVNICTLDLTKAFDRLNNFILFDKLMNLNVPKDIIKLVKCWYDKVFYCVKWGNFTSDYVKILAGVRQGGILSPYFFAIFVNNVLVQLTKSHLGCFIKTICYNSFMYADDIILLSLSVSHMQCMVDTCVQEFNDIDMEINIKKSGCLRIGNRHLAQCQAIVIGGKSITWLQEVKYLGIIIVSARCFKTNQQVGKQKFFSAINGIFGKIGLHTSAVVLCSLIDSFCLPILLYAAESLIWSNKSLRSIENSFSQAYFKIFNTFDKVIIQQCQLHLGYLPVRLLVDLRKFNYHYKISKLPNHPNFYLMNQDELSELYLRYNVRALHNRSINKRLIWSHFQDSVANV